MIFYFSATGNSKHVASRLKDETEELVFIQDAIRSGKFEYEISNASIGFIFPTYDWSLPSPVMEFLQKLTLKTEDDAYVYYVGTFGTTTGAAAAITEKILKTRGIRLNAKFDIRMPDTWTPVFDLSNLKKLAKINQQAEAEIEELIRQVKNRVTGKHMDLTTPVFTGMIGQYLYNSRTRRTINLSVNDACIGCGLCAKKCPVQAIEIRNKKPIWVKDRCVMCLGCLHRCPKFAIQYGNGKTAKHGQYTNPYEKI